MRSYDVGLLRDDGLETPSAAPGRAPGKRTLTMSLGAVQRKVTTGPGDPDEATIEAAAVRGVDSPGGGLPYGDVVQRAFGRHRLDQVQAHAGDHAAEACADMNAEAYATGDHLVFGGAPSLHTVAHEAAHFVQQRAGVARKGGGGDDHFERHADAVAERVVAGGSAEDLLDEVAPSTAAAPATAVQRKILVNGKKPIKPTQKKIDEHDGLRAMDEEKKTTYRFDNAKHINEFIAGERPAPAGENDEEEEEEGDAAPKDPKALKGKRKKGADAERKVKKAEPTKKAKKDDSDGEEVDGGTYERDLTLQTQFVKLTLRHPTPGRVDGSAVGGYQVRALDAVARPPVPGMDGQGQHKVAWRAIWAALLRCREQDLDTAHTTMDDIVSRGVGDAENTIDAEVSSTMSRAYPARAAALVEKAHHYLVARQSDDPAWPVDGENKRAQLAGKGEVSLGGAMAEWQSVEDRDGADDVVAPMFAVDGDQHMNKLFDALHRSVEEIADAVKRARKELEIHNPRAFARHRALIDTWLASRAALYGEES